MTGETDRGDETIAVDEVIVATGFRPDFTALSELRLDLHPWLESPRALGPLIDPNEHSCGTVPPHGEDELKHPEQGVYIVGMKSYGRAPTFLMITGYEQVRSVVAALAGDWAAARDTQLVLPETGVCHGPGVADPKMPTGSDELLTEPRGHRGPAARRGRLLRIVGSAWMPRRTKRFPYLLVSALGVGQLVAWGSFYYVFVSLTDPMADEFGWTKTQIAGALSVVLAITGLCSYAAGPVDRPLRRSIDDDLCRVRRRGPAVRVGSPHRALAPLRDQRRHRHRLGDDCSTTPRSPSSPECSAPTTAKRSSSSRCSVAWPAPCSCR